MHQPTAPHAARLRRAIGTLLLAAALGSWAAPDGPSGASTGDAILGLLVDRGLVASNDSLQLQTVRSKTSELVIAALNFLDVRYRNGGSSFVDGFDCSGFTRHVFATSVGLVLPRRVDEQASAAQLTPVQRSELQPGDLVFFNTLSRTFSHVGIYIGDSKFIHAPRTGTAVRVEDMRLAYWARRFTGARRAELGELATASP